MTQTAKCVVCGSESTKTANYETDQVFYECPVCGRFQLGLSDLSHEMDYNHLAPYLAHNRFDVQGVIEYRYHTALDKDTCDQYRQQFDSGNNVHGRPVHMDTQMIDAWYPKSFAEKIDKRFCCIWVQKPSMSVIDLHSITKRWLVHCSLIGMSLMRLESETSVTMHPVGMKPPIF